ncbi:MAG: ferritin family protein [Elusimicrobiota bacterium]
MTKDNLKEVMKSAIQMEKDGIEFYKDAAKNLQNPMGKEMFKSLVKDEARHLKLWRDLAEDLNLEEFGKEKAKEFSGKIKTIFSDISEDVMGTTKTSAEEKEVIQGAIKIEEKGIKFYSEKAESLSGKNADLAKRVADEERNHRKILENTLQYMENPKDWNVEQEHWFFEG